MKNPLDLNYCNQFQLHTPPPSSSKPIDFFFFFLETLFHYSWRVKPAVHKRLMGGSCAGCGCLGALGGDVPVREHPPGHDQRPGLLHNAASQVRRRPGVHSDPALIKAGGGHRLASESSFPKGESLQSAASSIVCRSRGFFRSWASAVDCPCMYEKLPFLCQPIYCIAQPFFPHPIRCTAGESSYPFLSCVFYHLRSLWVNGKA